MKAVEVFSSTAFSLSELESYGSNSFIYDDNGNMTRKTSGGEVTHYIYDIEDRLIRVEDDQGGVIADYYYDPFGRRLWKEVDGTRTYFIYCDEGLIGEYDSSGNEIKTYGWAPDSLWGTDPLFQKIGTQYLWYQNDHQGTPQKIIAANGLVVWSAVYDSFGNCQVLIDGIENNLRFAGQYFDAETGLHYNWLRYYDPGTGRYLRADPLGVGLNLYAYCFGNPLAWVDPFGLCAVHSTLAGLGMIPAFGIFPDLLDMLYYLYERDLLNAGISGMAAIPVLGLFTRGGQYFLKFLKFAERYLPDAINLWKRALNFGKKYYDDILRWIGAPKSGDELVTVYRGVHGKHPQFQNAIKGKAVPWGGHADPVLHNAGNNRSVYTSWTTDYSTAVDYALQEGPGGVVLKQSVPRSSLINSPDVFKESEVLREGTIEGATPIVLSP